MIYRFANQRTRRRTIVAGIFLSALAAACSVSAVACLAGPMPVLSPQVVSASDNAGRPDSVVPAPRQRPGWQEMHEKLKNQAKGAQVGLLFLGDSITERMSLARDLMEQRWGQAKPANFGIGGDSTQHLLWRLQDGELTGLQPRALVLLMGTNNIGHDSDDDIVTGVKADVDELRRLLPNTRVLVLALLPRGQAARDPVREHVRQINSKLSRLADNRYVFFTDVGSKLLTVDGSMSPEVMSDFLHPTHKGYQLMFDALKPAVDPLLH